jgi:hypothetical protein
MTERKRWTYVRKAELIAAVNNGDISLDGACQDNALSLDELLIWKAVMEQEGKWGLMLKKIPGRRPILWPAPQ